MTQIEKQMDLAAFVPLFWEIGNLKRLRAANLENTFAERLFYRAWGGINGGVSVRNAAVKITAEAVAAAQLGAIDGEILADAKLSDAEIKIILERAFKLSAAPINAYWRGILRDSFGQTFENSEALPAFVGNLARQPRSGATKPGAPKLVFDAPENHAEHCITVAVYAVLLAPIFNADVETVFLAALAHHFHNAYLPDAGFAGEELLGEFLEPIFNRFREQCLEQITPRLHDKIRATFVLTLDASTPEARAFHAADVLDRVLQMRHHAETNRFSLAYALDEMDLVHAGNVQKFHYETLRAAKIIE